MIKTKHIDPESPEGAAALSKVEEMAGNVRSVLIAKGESSPSGLATIITALMALSAEGSVKSGVSKGTFVEAAAGMWDTMNQMVIKLEDKEKSHERV